MIKYVIATHGTMASGIRSSLNILLGEAHHVDVINAYVDETNVKTVLEEKINRVPAEDTLILLSDLQGGSVNQYMMQYLDRENTYLITGVNLALVLELVAGCPEVVNEEILEEFVEKARAMMNVITLKNEVEQDEFF